MDQPQNRRQFWWAHCQRCRELGMTLKAYAAQEGLTLSVLYGWSKRFRQELAAGPVFSRVQLVSARAPSYRLHLPNGLVLEWDGDPDAGQLARLVKALA
jgi:hypothetical protein